ncbi:MAG TPA: hypothetical protein DCO77_00570 [Nitrospiraceae bacterium]|nr:hypothetical protein [Nitrospiraceae bacterium]
MHIDCFIKRLWSKYDNYFCEYQAAGSIVKDAGKKQKIRSAATRVLMARSLLCNTDIGER